MKKIVLPKFSKTTLVISSVFLCAYLTIRILIKFNIYIYLFGVSKQEIMPFITIPCVASLIASIAVLIYKNIGHKTLVALLTIVTSFLIFSYMLLDYSFSPSSEYFEFTSNDKKHSIVVNEKSFLLSGGGVIYEKTSFCTMKRVGGYSTDDGFCPFSNDAFYFVWNENDFELYHSFFGSKSEEYRVVKMEYVK